MTPSPTKLLTTKQLPAITGLSKSFFEKGRIYGYGPRFIRIKSGRRAGKFFTGRKMSRSGWPRISTTRRRPVMADGLAPDAQKAIAFLLWLNPDAPLYLEAHESAGGAKPKPKDCPAHSADTVARPFVTANNGSELRRNLYFVPNAEFMSGGRAKANISASRFLWADLDCKDYPGTASEQRDTILGLLTEDKLRPAGVPKPTAFWFTGGGYQAIWRMAEPIAAADAEALNRALLVAFQAGAGPIDVGRLLRLPETVNWLSDAKRSRGREPAMASLLDPVVFDAEPVSYALSDFNLRQPKAQAIAVLPQAGTLPDVADLEPLPLPG